MFLISVFKLCIPVYLAVHNFAFSMTTDLYFSVGITTTSIIIKNDIVNLSIFLFQG